MNIPDPVPAPIVTVSNFTESHEVELAGECLAMNRAARCCVRRSLSGLFVVMGSRANRAGVYPLVESFRDLDHARHYQAKIRFPVC